jgi:hypothetical protein
VKTRDGALIASGSCAAASPARCSLKAPLTRRGRALLKGSNRARLTLVLMFTPRAGFALFRRATVILTK